MPPTRRRFIKTSVLSALAAGCALSTGLKVFGQETQLADTAANFRLPYEAGQNSIFYYTPETFEPYVGGVFRGLGRGRPVEARLLRVDSYTPSRETKISTKPSPPTRTFTLTFQTNRALRSPTNTYNLHHAALGKFTLTMTPTAAPDGQFFYEAVFNHLA